MRIGALSPLILLLAGAVLTLVIGIFLPRARQGLAALIALTALASAAFIALVMTRSPPGLVMGDGFAADAPFAWLTVMLCAGAAVLAGMLRLEFRGDVREAELYLFLLLALIGALLMAGAADFRVLLVGALIAAVAGYALTAARRDDPAAMEALLKFYLFGALTNLALAMALVLLFGLTGSTGFHALAALDPANRLAVATALVLLMVGLGFKGGYVPAQFWIPDVYQGASLPVAALLSVVPKVAAAVAAARLAAALDPERINFEVLLSLIAAATMTWGNLGAFRQEQAVRLLGYSSIAQAGYLLLAAVAVQRSPLAGTALLFAIAAYIAGNLTAFAALSASGARTLAELGGLSRRAPWVAFSLGVGVLSLLGLPPLAGFVGKFLLFTAVLQAGYPWLMVLALANTVLSLFYYLRVIAALFVGAPLAATVTGGGTSGPLLGPEREPAADAPAVRLDFGSLLAIALAAITVLLGVGAVLLLGPTGTAVRFEF